ncbi:helix-turn-helix domain-containing protein [Clostridium omnivorum]|uniref:HTH-type transcriptional regulator YtdP n=1 Tax=Clostridium omnivorum TaxID=1604902 RepID=A0ABQ5N6P9_9CLOT|nr:helix-turn-helix domain-containing protein [Clostridium sp. E14]GLC30889.1 putative HTH-type transcriptional regulator YtdP [Clostridium sp. E14]
MIKSFIKSKIIKRNSIMFTWAVSYIVILLLPIFISIIMYAKVDSLVKDEINRANDFYLSQVQQYMDSIADNIKLMSVQLAYNDRIQELIPVKAPFDDNQYYSFYEGVKELSNYKIANSSINNFFIYLNNSDFIMNDKGSFENKDYYDIYSGMNNYGYDKWLKLIKGDYRGGKFVSIPKEGKSNEKSIYYIITFPSLRQTDVTANFITAIDESQFIKMTDNGESLNKGQLMIINEDNDVIAGEAKKGQLPDWLDYKKLDKSRGVLLGDYNGEKVVVSYVSSQVEKCKYIHIMHERVFWEKLEYARRIIYLSVLFCIILGGGMTYILLKRNYAPMEILMSELKGMPEQCQDNEADEYQFIKKTITKAVSEKEEFNKKLISQNSILKLRFIERLLKGNFGDITVNDSLVTYDINFDSNYFSAMLFYIEDFSEVFLEQTNYNSLEAFRIAQFVIINILEELAYDKCGVLVTETDGMLAAVVNLKSDKLQGAEELIKEITRELQNFIKKYYKIDFTIAVSSIHEGIEGINAAYNETLEAMEYKVVMGVGGVIFYDDTKVKINNDYYYPIEKEQQIINCVKTGDFENVRLVIEDVYKRNFDGKELSPQNAKCLFFNLVSTILKTINDLNTISSDEFSDELSKIQELINNKTVSKVKDEFEDILKVICDKINCNKKNKNCAIKNKVDDYIISNYKDENLSISAIADYFDMHPSYISKLYKAQSGEGILDQINKVRIEKSKQIMKEQKINLDDVAKATGYSNVRTFTRAFMKIEGITPGKYKETNQIM